MARFTPPIQTFASESNTLGKIIKKCRELERLERLITKHLDADLLPHTHVANLEQGCLVLQSASPAWATRLRYLIPDLLKKLRKETGLEGLGSIKTYIQPID